MRRKGTSAGFWRCSALALAVGLSGSLACNRLESDGKGKTNVVREPIAPEEVLHESGLKIQELDPGVEGPAAAKGQVVAIHYTGWLTDGTKVDSTRNRQPLQFQLGEGTVMKGWDLGIVGMKLGAKRKLTIPPALALGSGELGQIKPDSTLVFEIELVKIQ